MSRVYTRRVVVNATAREGGGSVTASYIVVQIVLETEVQSTVFQYVKDPRDSGRVEGVVEIRSQHYTIQGCPTLPHCSHIPSCILSVARCQVMSPGLDFSRSEHQTLAKPSHRLGLGSGLDFRAGDRVRLLQTWEFLRMARTY